ncbi:GNAT family N-acetyltransferase [Rhodococcus tibetensis]|uniref:GNAT family N-acetyltransferase n=1 Tax=Rhodococcus tibetensis TaxID=2965064 RepID=A0ABT1Q8A6_9NOCA|nr:GNAT family N-acetyltransferase [Rhodococcus sp. FXJ9.536]MCQ4118489.1 GNAT family N-acetyltransferase [Rhodococcus sp. FXJ9.536]
MIEVKRGNELGEGYRRQITEVLVRGFAEDFTFFSSDPAQLTTAFEHMLLMERFVVALAEGEPAAIASVTSGDQECFAPRLPEFRRHLGLLRGTISYLVVRSQFLGVPDQARDGLAEIGFVTTAPAHQRRGLGNALMQYIVGLPGYDEFILRDIKDTNAPALGLYRKFGFTEYRRRPVRFARRAGFSQYLSLILKGA